MTCPFGQFVLHHAAKRRICLSGRALSYLKTDARTRFRVLEEIMNRRLLPLAASAVIGTFFAVHSPAQNPPPSVAPVTPVSSVTKVDPSASPLPSTKDLLQKFESVSGGRGVWSGFTTRYMKGIYQTEDASGFAAIEVFSKSPNKALFKITLSNGV